MPEGEVLYDKNNPFTKPVSKKPPKVTQRDFEEVYSQSPDLSAHEDSNLGPSP